MDPALLAVCGLLIGLTLLVLEFFIPSGGLIFILACISLVVGVWGAWKAWGDDHFWAFGTYLGAIFIFAPAAIVGGLYLLNNTAYGDRILLKAPKPEDVVGLSEENDKLKQLVGQRGKTLGLLNPGGMVTVDGTRYHCESEGMLIDPGTEVEVVSAEGPRLVVRVPFGPKNSQDMEVVETESKDEADTTPFDFDVPDDA